MNLGFLLGVLWRSASVISKTKTARCGSLRELAHSSVIVCVYIVHIETLHHDDSCEFNKPAGKEIQPSVGPEHESGTEGARSDQNESFFAPKHHLDAPTDLGGLPSPHGVV